MTEQDYVDRTNALLQRKHPFMSAFVQAEVWSKQRKPPSASTCVWFGIFFWLGVLFLLVH